MEENRTAHLLEHTQKRRGWGGAQREDGEVCLRHVEFEASLGYLDEHVYQEVSDKHLQPRRKGWTTATDLKVFVMEAINRSSWKDKISEFESIKREETRPIS